MQPMESIQKPDHVLQGLTAEVTDYAKTRRGRSTRRGDGIDAVNADWLDSHGGQPCQLEVILILRRCEAVDISQERQPSCNVA